MNEWYHKECYILINLLEPSNVETIKDTFKKDFQWNFLMSTLPESFSIGNFNDINNILNLEVPHCCDHKKFQECHNEAIWFGHKNNIQAYPQDTILKNTLDGILSDLLIMQFIEVGIIQLLKFKVQEHGPTWAIVIKDTNSQQLSFFLNPMNAWGQTMDK